MTSEPNLARLRDPFAPEDIEWRVQQAGEKNGRPWARVLAYVTNRAIMERLDEVVGPEGTVDGPLMVVSEDMSEFLNRVPGCFYFVGSRNEPRGLTWGHHHAQFDIDEDAMAIGVETMTRTVLRFLTS